MTDNVREGWGNPVFGEKWHYFVKDVTAPSLCRKYTWFGVATLVQGNDASVDNCADCKRKLVARRAEGMIKMADITWRDYTNIEGVNDTSEIYSYRRKADRENYDLIKPTNGGFPAIYRCAKCGAIMLIDAEYTSDVFEGAGWWAVDEDSFDPAREVAYFCDRHKYAAHLLAAERGTYVDTCDCGGCCDLRAGGG